jgi:hypothetical protein
MATSAASPARMLQAQLASAFVGGAIKRLPEQSHELRWSPRRTLLFVTLASILLWSLIGAGLYAALR